MVEEIGMTVNQMIEFLKKISETGGGEKIINIRCEYTVPVTEKYIFITEEEIILRN